MREIVENDEANLTHSYYSGKGIQKRKLGSIGTEDEEDRNVKKQTLDEKCEADVGVEQVMKQDEQLLISMNRDKNVMDLDDGAKENVRELETKVTEEESYESLKPRYN